MAKTTILQVVVETNEFVRQASSCMDQISRKRFIDFIAANPLVGDLIVGTGGARKVRWAGDSARGKRGGARVIYYYHDRTMPIFLFTAYGKGIKANLSQAERNSLRNFIKEIALNYGRCRNE